MPRFFLRQNSIEDGHVTVEGDDARHIARALRMAVGDSLTVCDMQGNEYNCVITAFDEDVRVSADIVSVKAPENEPLCRIRLFQALPKGDKLDTVIQKAVECGVSEIYPFESERCIVKVKADAEERKTQRREKISEEAAKQCGRSAIPTVSRTVSFSEMISRATESDICLFCYEGDGTVPLGRVLSERLVADGEGRYPDVSVVIGSEGGFSQREVAEAEAAGMIKIGLGRRILRTETASGFVLSCIVCATELS